MSTTGGAAQDTAERVITSRPCLLRFLESEEADMVHRPKSLFGYVFAFLIALGVAYVAVSLMDALSSPWLWGTLAVIAAATLVVVLLRRRLEAARERAWIGSFSFAEVVERRRTEEALRRAESAG
jgi:Flp pilus assembly protein TadB